MKLRLMKVAAFCGAAMLVISPAYAANNDGTLSQHIMEADGTSGQDTNTGAGVKTGHIQDGAVTSAKISGVISAGNLPVGTTAGTVAAGDHGHDTLYQKRYANIVVVAISGGDFTNPIAAVNSVSDASATNPYLVKIMPGIYDLGSAPLAMKEYVDVEGSGQGNTVLTSTVGNAAYGFDAANTVATVKMADRSELRNLAVINTANLNGWALLFDASAATSDWISGATNVTASSAGLTSDLGRSAIAVRGSSARVTLRNLDVAVEIPEPECSDAWAIRINEAHVDVYDSVVKATGGWPEAFVASSAALNIHRTKAEISYTPTGGYGCYVVDAGNSTTTINDSVLRVTNCTPLDYSGAAYGSNVIVRNSELYDCKCGGDVKAIASSFIYRDPAATGCMQDAKIVNCWDQNYEPIPNQ